MSLIRADGVNFSYFGSLEPVFTDLNFTADTSWRTGLIGANGSGKTTLFKILCGEEKCGGKIVSNDVSCASRLMPIRMKASAKSLGGAAKRGVLRGNFLCWGSVRMFVTARSARFRAGSGQRLKMRRKE